MPYMMQKDDDGWCIYKRGMDGKPMGEPMECHENEADAQKKMKTMHAQMAEFTLSEYREHEFKGPFPTVPTYAQIDKDLLYRGDDDPFHVVLPIARVGETSGNGLVYDEALLGEIEQQLPGFGGIRGHNFDPAQFPTETHDVIGHTRDGDTLWAKLYIPPGAVREDTRRRKARGGKIGTSIFGQFAKRETLGGGKWRAKGLTLESLDFGPISRTALNLGGAFAVVSELQHDTNGKDDDMDREQFLAELKLDDIPQALREAIIRDHTDTVDGEHQVAELQQAVTAKDNTIAELNQRISTFERETFETALTSKIAEQVKIEALRPVVRRFVLAELNGAADDDKATKTLAEYLGSDEYKALAKALVAELAGPGALVRGAGIGSNWRDEMVENSAQIAKEAGVIS